MNFVEFIFKAVLLQCFFYFFADTIPSAGEVSWNITNKEVSQLSQGLVGVLNEKFCKDLLTTTQVS